MAYVTEEGVPVTAVAIVEMTGNLAIGRYTTKIDYDANGNPIYIGIARGGSATSDTKWFLKKLIYSGNNLTDMQCAQGEISFDKQWDLRSTYGYS
jgi:hypothetical protein